MLIVAEGDGVLDGDSVLLGVADGDSVLLGVALGLLLP